MRAFLVAAQTPVYTIKDGKEWSGKNVHQHITQEENIFFLEEICVDPTGIGKTMACVPGAVTVGSHWAEMGYYGFRRDGWAILVPAHLVTVH